MKFHNSILNKNVVSLDINHFLLPVSLALTFQRTCHATTATLTFYSNQTSIYSTQYKEFLGRLKLL